MNYSIFTFSFFYLFSLLLSSLLSVFQSHNLSLCRWWFGRKQAVEDVDLKNRVWLQNTLNRMNDVFTVVFFIEMVIKMLALGFKTYFTNAWCWLDFVIVAVSFYNFLKSKRFRWIPNTFLCCLFSLWAFFSKRACFLSVIKFKLVYALSGFILIHFISFQDAAFPKKAIWSRIGPKSLSENWKNKRFFSTKTWAFIKLSFFKLISIAS